MKLKDLDENFNVAVASLIVWINCIRDPAAMRAELADPAMPADRKMALAMRIWAIATLIGLIIQLPVYAFLHVEWTKIELYLPAVLLLLIAFLMTVAIIHVGLRIYGVPSSFPDTLGAYSLIVGAWSPIIMVCTLPSIAGVMSGLRAAKQAGAEDIGTVVGTVFRYMNDPALKSLTLQVFQEISVAILMAFSIATLVAFQRSIAALYNIDRTRAVSAISFALGVLFPVPMVVVTGLYYFTFYASL